MEKTLLILCLTFGFLINNSHYLNAQDEQSSSISNKLFLGGTVVISNADFESPGSRISVFTSNNNFVNGEQIGESQFNISPYLGLKLNERASLGISTFLVHVKSNYFDQFANSSTEENFSTRTLTIGAGLFYRYDFSINRKLTFFVQPSINYSKWTFNLLEQSNSEQITKADIIGLQPFLGARVSLFKKWNVIATIFSFGYQYQSFNPVTENNSRKTNFHIVNLDLSLRQISIGIERSF